MTNLDSVLKSKDIALLTKVRIAKDMVFPVVMYGCESWTIKKAERRRIDVFKLWYSRRLLRVPWTAKRSNQSILKEINYEYSQEGLKLNLKLQYFWPCDAKSRLTGKDSDAGKIESKSRRERQKMRWLDSIMDSMDMNLGKLQETGRPGMLQCMG